MLLHYLQLSNTVPHPQSVSCRTAHPTKTEPRLSMWRLNLSQWYLCFDLSVNSLLTQTYYSFIPKFHRSSLPPNEPVQHVMPSLVASAGEPLSIEHQTTVLPPQVLASMMNYASCDAAQLTRTCIELSTCVYYSITPHAVEH